MVYFPDTSTYDLIPEYKFPSTLVDTRSNVIWPGRNVPYCGAIVQALRMDSTSMADVDGDDDGGDGDGDERGIMEGGMGVRIVLVVSNGEASWWTVKRNDDEFIGVDEIVL